MSSKPFYIVDVFAKDKYTGNQLAVFEHCPDLSESEMCRIAREINFSESVFLGPPQEILNKCTRYNIRIFTPTQEIPFAGHPVLGTAYIIQKQFIKKSVSSITLNLAIGQIQVYFEYCEDIVSKLWMEQPDPTFDTIINPNQVLDFLNLTRLDVVQDLPIQAVSSGLPFIIVPLKNLDAVRRAKILSEKYQTFIRDSQAKAILIYCQETYDNQNDLNVRMFAPHYGVSEDPATGSGNGCLASYLINHDVFRKDSLDIRVEQGYEIGRKSLIYLKSQVISNKDQVLIGGSVIMVAKGEFI